MGKLGSVGPNKQSVYLTRAKARPRRYYHLSTTIPILSVGTSLTQLRLMFTAISSLYTVFMLVERKLKKLAFVLFSGKGYHSLHYIKSQNTMR